MEILSFTLLYWASKVRRLVGGTQGSLLTLEAVVNIATNKVVRILGKDDPNRWLNLSLYQGSPAKKGFTTAVGIMHLSWSTLLIPYRPWPRLLTLSSPNVRHEIQPSSALRTKRIASTSLHEVNPSTLLSVLLCSNSDNHPPDQPTATSSMNVQHAKSKR